MPVYLQKEVSNPTKIIDIRSDTQDLSLKKAILDGLNPKIGGEKQLTTLLLYDEAGLKLFEEITYLEEYYPTNTEIHVLEQYAKRMAQCIPEGAILLELGSGNLRKVNILLKAIDEAGKHVDYYALDLSYVELERTLAAVPDGTFKHVRCHGLYGTYDDGLVWLQKDEVKSRPKVVLSLGSSIGNFPRPEAAQFLHNFAEALTGPGDALLIGLDGCKDHDTVWHAYNDKEGTTLKFYQNGLLNANKILGNEVFNLDQWDIVGIYNDKEGRHEAFITPLQDVTVEGITCRKGERIRIEEAYKYNNEEAHTLWRTAGLTETHKFAYDGQVDYAIHMLQKHNIYACSPEPAVYATAPAPSMDDWQELWKLWDTVTRKMLPDEELLEKPIKLRNACIFYLGHIPTFCDMKIADETNGKHTEPAYYPSIFERGIDPDVDNPEQCHAHSEIPDEWPPLNEILAFQGRVRERIKGLYKSGEADTAKVARVLWLGYEHEAMHLETLLYMLLQSEKTLPPPDCARPNFEVEAELADSQAVENEWYTIPEQDIVVGLDDPETVNGPSRHFGWDIEKPARPTHVHSFSARGRPITNGEYAEYLEKTNNKKIPASWSEQHTTNGHTINGSSSASSSFLKNKAVRTVYGFVPLSHALHWPVSASYDELNACAAYMGGRIPTFEEARSIYHFVEMSKKKQKAAQSLNSGIPAVNGHLVNNGVTETPPSANGKKSEVDPHGTFVDLSGANVGFQRWAPIAVTGEGGKLAGQGDMGGLWEWTSTPLKRHEGFEEMPLYPAYSSDFFDGKHNIVLGGSWATVPRIAGRKSFVNWYQRNYLYCWAGARLVKDI